MPQSTTVERLQAAREMVGIQHASGLLKINRNSLQRYRNLNLTDKDGKAPTETIQGEDDMMVLGDLHQTINAPTATEANKTAPASSAMGTLGKLAIAGALVASGAGIGAAVPIVIDLLKPKPAVTAPPVAAADSDSWYEFGIWPPPEAKK